MLQKLSVRNYAIIDELTIEPDAHLNTVTGETGAGKSIILGALSLILGDRADSSVLINKEEKCIVEACFDVRGNEPFLGALRREELDEDGQCIIRREIGVSGKSRAFINDTPVTLNVLNRLTSLLVDLHQQFGHLALQDDRFQMDVTDAIAGNAAIRKSYEKTFRAYKQASAELAAQQERQRQWQKEADYKQFLYEELVAAAFGENEIEEAEQQSRQLSHAERIIGVLQSGRGILEDGEQPLTNELRRIGQQLQQITDLVPEAADLQQRLSSAYAELKDVAGELERLERKISLDPELQQRLQERIDLGYRLCKKHGLQTTSELLQLQAQLAGELQATQDLNDIIAALTLQQQQLYSELLGQAAKLSEQRIKTAPKIAERVNALFPLVGMPNSRLKINITPLHAPVESGMDQVDFLLDANLPAGQPEKNAQYQPVYKAASGGEMSRIMLCIKSLTAKAMHLPTLIFDEVDTGISGEAAKQVGLLLKELAAHHQVICITHQPQVAAKGSRHFFVYKDAGSGKRITTKVRVLQPAERVFAIAQMIGGERPGDAALQHAKELVAV